MADGTAHTEDWAALPWKQYQRNVYRLQNRIYRAARQPDARRIVPVTMARTLRSRMRRKSHVRFCSGGGAGDRPADHNRPTPTHAPFNEKCLAWLSSWLSGIP